MGGIRNWDYRYCWLRDSTLTLGALVSAGYHKEAEAWRDWLLRAVAGDPADLQIMYGVAGERRLPEFELPHLSGFGGSAPVRIGNGAVNQLQLDVYGGGDGLLVAGPARGSVAQAAHVVPAERPPGLAARPVEAAGRGPLGGARRAPALRALQGDGLGGRRPRGAHPGGVRRPLGRSGGLARTARRGAPGGVREGLRPRTQHVHAVLRVAGARRRPPAHPRFGFLPADDPG